LLLLIIGSVTYAFLQKRRDNRLISAQKKKVEQQKSIIENKNKDITDSIRYAEGIQKSILPTAQQVTGLLPDSFVWYRPKDIVSGDFYWVVENNGKVYFAACDCTGHGVPGALMSMVGTSLLNEALATEGIQHPAEIFEVVRQGYKQSLKQEGHAGEQRDGMDAVLCAWDKNSKLEFALAYNSLIYIRNEELIEIKPDKQPVGFHEMGEKPFTFHEIKVEKGDCIYLFSDGMQDQFGGPKGKKFKIRQLKQLLLDNHQKSMASQKETLQKAFASWKGSLEQVDDILMIGLRV
jgi:serine phosphatase RsbU (regulator of sigma subunit)